MKRLVAAGLSGGLVAASLLFATSAAADIKIGVIYDHTGAFAAGGSKAAAIGNKIAIDMINEKGGVEGHKIIAIDADAQSKTDVAINEAERLLNDAKVDLLMGVFSSAHCVPMAARVDAAKKFMWANVCVASAVFKDKNLQYVFRPAGPFRSVRRSIVHVRGRECQIQAEKGDQGRQGRHHPRGRPLRRRRGHGQRGQVQGAGPPDRAQGRVRGHFAGSCRPW